MKATVLAAGRLSGFILLVPTPALGQSELPRPTGQYGIGRTVLHWTDPARPETESGTTDSRRELLVYLLRHHGSLHEDSSTYHRAHNQSRGVSCIQSADKLTFGCGHSRWAPC